MNLESFVRPELCWVVEKAEGRDALLRDLTRRIAEQIDGVEAEPLFETLIDRESKGPTSTPDRVAFPHAMVEGVQSSFVATVVVKSGVKFGHKSHPKSQLVFVLVGPPEAAWDHIRLLARLARICHAPGAVERLFDSDDSKQLFSRLQKEDARHG
jgi:PTS system nitrogen regulatory IIA component